MLTWNISNLGLCSSVIRTCCHYSKTRSGQSPQWGPEKMCRELRSSCSANIILFVAPPHLMVYPPAVTHLCKVFVVQGLYGCLEDLQVWHFCSGPQHSSSSGISREGVQTIRTRALWKTSKLVQQSCLHIASDACAKCVHQKLA